MFSFVLIPLLGDVNNIADFLRYLTQALDTLGWTPYVTGFLIIMGTLAVIGGIRDLRNR